MNINKIYHLLTATGLAFLSITSLYADNNIYFEKYDNPPFKYSVPEFYPYFYIRKPFQLDNLNPKLKEKALSQLDSYLNNDIEMVIAKESGKNLPPFKDSNRSIYAALKGEASIERFAKYWQKKSYSTDDGLQLLIKFNDGDEDLKIDTPLTHIGLQKKSYLDLQVDRQTLTKQQTDNFNTLKNDLIKLKNENDRLLSQSTQFDQHYNEKLQNHNSLKNKLEAQKTNLKLLEDSSSQVSFNDLYNYISLDAISFNKLWQDFKHYFHSICFGNHNDKKTLISSQINEIKKLEDELNSLANELSFTKEKNPVIASSKPLLDLKLDYETLKPIFKTCMNSPYKTISDPWIAKHLTAFDYSINNVYDINQYFKETKAIADAYVSNETPQDLEYPGYTVMRNYTVFHKGYAVIHDVNLESVKIFLSSIGSKILSESTALAFEPEIEHLRYTNQDGQTMYILIKSFTRTHFYGATIIEISSKPFEVNSHGEPKLFCRKEWNCNY